MIPRSNIETKAHCPDLERAAAYALREGALFAGVLDQRDTYFGVRDGRLKLRVMETWTAEDGSLSQAELITYHRPNAVRSRVSSYTIERVMDPEAVLGRLTREHGVRGVVAKRRQLWLLENTRIHLDHVAQLGDFLELETVASAHVDDDLWDEHRRLCVALGIIVTECIASSYIDLVDAVARGAAET